MIREKVMEKKKNTNYLTKVFSFYSAVAIRIHQ